MVPASHLSLFAWYELETMVCGLPTVDVETLRRHTAFRGGYSANHHVVQWLFRALTSFTAEERSLFLRFVWGRSRLPLNDADWDAPFTVNMMQGFSGGTSCVACGFVFVPRPLGGPPRWPCSAPSPLGPVRAAAELDGKLPVAHTCFFSLDLPPYSSYEVLRAKVSFAIVNCQAIDADFNPTDSAMSTWVDV